MKYEIVNYCEIDKWASQNYSKIHNISKSLNLGDITKVNTENIEDFDLLVGGSPCTDFSCAGTQKGSKWICEDCGHVYNPITIHYSKRHKCPMCSSQNLNQTASSLIVEYMRILKDKKPKIAIYENVKNLLGKSFFDTFQLFIKELEEYGYKVFYKVMNSKYYGIPQNRERIILVAIRKDIVKNDFIFPTENINMIPLKDLLLENAPQKYFVNQKEKDRLLNSLNDTIKKELYDALIGTNDTISFPICCASRGRNPKNPNDRTVGAPTVQRLEINRNNTTNTLTTVQKDNYILQPNPEINITNYNSFHSDLFILRKLLPIETFRLMGFTDNDFYHAKYLDDNKTPIISDTQLLKQAGNSIVVNVLYIVFEELMKDYPDVFKNLKVVSLFSGIGAFEKALFLLYTQKNTTKI